MIFYCLRCPYPTTDFRILILHRLRAHREDVRPWVVSTRPHEGAITAYRMGKERNART